MRPQIQILKKSRNHCFASLLSAEAGCYILFLGLLTEAEVAIAGADGTTEASQAAAVSELLAAASGDFMVRS